MLVSTDNTTQDPNQTCDGCGAPAAHETEEYGLQCARCEAYLRACDTLKASLAVTLEAWRVKRGLSHEGAPETAHEFSTLRDDLQRGLMAGKTWTDLVSGQD